MFASLFSQLGTRIFGGLSLALALALLVQSVRLDQAKAHLETAIAERDLARAANDRMIDEGNRRTEAAKSAVEETKPRTDKLIKQAEAIRREPVKDDCETPDSVLSSEL